MNVTDLVTRFGAAAPWLVSLAAVTVIGVIVAAFVQGRSISIWPPGIGSHPAACARAAPGVAGEPPGGAAGEPPADREFPVHRAQGFYQEVAPNYDLRNSGNLVQTHLATVAQLQQLRAQRSSLRVLDLGGGTGKLIAIAFFNDPSITWTYVDFCPAMAAQFRRNLAGYPLGRSAEVHVEDFTRVLPGLAPHAYDVVLLSLVLSSMPAMPDFGLLARTLAPGGALIVTDINPGYTFAKPLYKVPVGGETVALRTTPVDPFDVIRRAEAAGLCPTEQRALGEGSTYYSFVTVFTSTPIRRLDATALGAAPATLTAG